MNKLKEWLTKPFYLIYGIALIYLFCATHLIRGTYLKIKYGQSYTETWREMAIKNYTPKRNLQS